MRHRLWVLLLLAGCTSAGTGAVSSTSGTTSATADGGGTSESYASQTIELVASPVNLSVVFAAPNIVFTATPPAYTSDVDYVLVLQSDPTQTFHLTSNASDAAFKVTVLAGQFLPGDYTVKAYAGTSTAPFGSAALHVSTPQYQLTPSTRPST